MGKRDHQDADGDELWQRVTATAAPLRKNRRAPAAVPKPAKAAKPGAKKPQPRRTATPGPKVPLAPVHVARSAPLPRDTARRLESGRLEVEARLDLHGFRQRDAHAALRRFLQTAQMRGHRHVLVITGKGAAQDAPASFYDEERRGVLRQAVPAWLAQPEFGSLVVSFAPAPRRLGGDGALYVRVRKGRSH